MSDTANLIRTTWGTGTGRRTSRRSATPLFRKALKAQSTISPKWDASGDAIQNTWRGDEPTLESTNRSNGTSSMTAVTEAPSSLPSSPNKRRRGSLDHWIRPEIDFFPHQEEGIKWLKPKLGAILGDEMGLGKTIQALGMMGMHIWDSVKKDPSRRCAFLVIVPASLRINWSEEIEEATTLDYTLVGGGLIERFSQIEKFKKKDSHKILVMNYEVVEDHIQQLNTIGFDIRVFDEAHVLKNRETKNYKNCAQLVAKRTLLMTGTPMTNQVDDLWTLLDLATPGQWGTFRGFRSRYCVLGGHNGKQVMAVKNERQLNAKLSQVMLRRKIDEVIALPEVRIIKRMVSLEGRPREMYNYLATEEKLQKYVPNLSDESEEALQWPMVKATRMRQICASTCTLVPEWDESPKLDLAIEDVVEILDNGHKVIVFTQYKEIIKAYKRRLAEARPNTPIYEIHGGVAKDKRQAIVKKWGAEEAPGVVIGIIKAMGVGLNMTQAHHGQFIDKEFSPALNNQAIGRLRRIGSEKHGQPIQIMEYQVRNSADMRVEVILKDKTHSFETVVEGSVEHAGFMEKIKDALEQTL